MSSAAKRDEGAPATGMILLTPDQLRTLVKEAVTEALGNTNADGWYDTGSAAKYLVTTARSIQGAVARGFLVPDHRGSRGGGLKGNRFTKETLDAYALRRKTG